MDNNPVVMFLRAQVLLREEIEEIRAEVAGRFQHLSRPDAVAALQAELETYTSAVFNRPAADLAILLDVEPGTDPVLHFEGLLDLAGVLMAMERHGLLADLVEAVEADAVALGQTRAMLEKQ
jgi:hypothetical protein